MARLIISNNIAIFEYPECKDPEFTFEAENELGFLFIYGYDFTLVGKTIKGAKRFDLKLYDFKILGKYDEAKKIIEGDLDHLMEGVDKENCVLFGKTKLKVEG